MISSQRAEMNALENEIDKEHAQELNKIYDDINEKTREELKTQRHNIINKIEKEGKIVTFSLSPDSASVTQRKLLPA